MKTGYNDIQDTAGNIHNGLNGTWKDPYTPWRDPFTPWVPCPPCPPVQPPFNVTTWTNISIKQRAPIHRRPCETFVTKKGKKETYITLILDKSTSMESCYKSALDAINEQIRTIKKNAKKGGNTYVSLLLFSSDVEIVYENVPAARVRLLERADYVLDGCTALRDAVLTGIEVMEARQCASKNQGFLSVLISDGQENMSGTDRETLRSRIQELQKTDRWTFSYLLSGHSWQDVQDVSFYSNTSLQNIAVYNATPQGTAVASSGLNKSLTSYMSSRGSGQTKTDAFYTDTDLKQ